MSFYETEYVKNAFSPLRAVVAIIVIFSIHFPFIHFVCCWKTTAGYIRNNRFHSLSGSLLFLNKFDSSSTHQFSSLHLAVHAQNKMIKCFELIVKKFYDSVPLG